MSDTLVKYHRDYCIVATRELVLNEPVRFMNAVEIAERITLNVDNTTTALRQRILAETSKQNGHGDSRTVTRSMS